MKTDNAPPPTDDTEASNAACAGCMARLVRLESVNVYIASIEAEMLQFESYRKSAIAEAQYSDAELYGAVHAALEMAVDNARKIILPNAKRMHPLPGAEDSNTNQKSNHE